MPYTPGGPYTVGGSFTSGNGNNIETGISGAYTQLESITGNEAASLPSSSGPFTLANFINYIITQIKNITGAAHWYSTPATSIASLNTNKANLSGAAFTGGITVSGNTVWHAGNDGSGSGLDADTLDGIGSSGFVRATTGLTGSFKAQTTAPTSPADGDLWLDTSTVL